MLKSFFNAFSFKLILFKNLNLCTSYIKQIMKVSHSCNGTNIFIRWKMKCTIQLGFASLNGTFHLSPHENICTIALINIHYLYTNAPTQSSRIWRIKISARGLFWCHNSLAKVKVNSQLLIYKCVIKSPEKKVWQKKKKKKKKKSSCISVCRLSHTSIMNTVMIIILLKNIF